MTDNYKTAIEDIKKLELKDRILIVEDIWDSIVSSNAEYPIPDEQKKELDIRLKENLENPDKAKSWEEVKKNIQSKL
jgi:putative addiction module component (TIGR02574 family)